MFAVVHTNTPSRAANPGRKEENHESCKNRHVC